MRPILAFFPISISSDTFFGSKRKEGAGEYITVSLNTSLKGWNARWFYMKQSHPAIRCDIDQVLENQRS